MSIAYKIIVLAVFLIVLGGTTYYVARKIYHCIHFIFPQIYIKTYTIIIISFALVMVLGFSRAPVPIPYGIRKIWGIISAYWMGFFIYLLLFFILSDAVLFVGKLLKVVSNPLSERLSFIFGLLVVLMSMGTAGYGVYHANQIEYKSYDIQIEKNASISDFKIVLISDIHLGAVNSEERIEKMVQGINGLEPDLVCIAGDIFDNDYYALHDADTISDTLKKISSRYGVYACLGNHDSGKTSDKMFHFLERSNISLLADEYVIIDDRLVLAGRLDMSPIGGLKAMVRKGMKEIVTEADIDLPIVVMDHNPSNIDEYGAEISLVLSGHTHKGQIFPGSLFTKLIYGERSYGYSKKDADSPHVVVTSGIGTWGMPMRVGTDCEIVSILLHFSLPD